MIKSKATIVKAIKYVGSHINYNSIVHSWPDENDMSPRDCSSGYVDSIEGRVHIWLNDWILFAEQDGLIVVHDNPLRGDTVEYTPILKEQISPHKAFHPE